MLNDMSSSSLIVLLGLIAAVTWGIADFFAAKSTHKVAPLLGVTLVNIFSTLLFGVIFALFFRSHWVYSEVGFGFAALGGIILSLGAAIFFIALKAGPVSIVSPLTSTYPLVATILAITAFQAVLSSSQVAGILLTCVGIVLAAGLVSLRPAERKLAKGPVLALVTAVFWGIGNTIIAQAIKRLDWQVVSLIAGTVGSLALLLLLAFTGNRQPMTWFEITSGLRNKYILLAAVIQLLGACALDIGIARSTNASGAVVIAMSATCPLLTVALVLRYTTEQFKFVPIAGGVIGVAGVVLLSLG